jgi:hypothetical protein
LRLVLGDHVTSRVAPLLLVETQWEAPQDDPARQPDPCDSIVSQGAKDATLKVQRFLVNADPAASASLWTLYAAPSDMRYLLDVTLGRMSIDIPRRGTYSLYVGNDCSPYIEFTSLPEPDLEDTPLADRFPLIDRDNNPGAVYARSLTAPSGAACLAALPQLDDDGNTTLYVGAAQGIYRFHSTAQSKNASADVVRDDTVLARISALVARQDGQKIALFAVNNDQDLIYLSGQQNASDPAWSTPLVQAQKVAHIAARVNQKRGGDELFSTTSDNTTVSHLWRDPESTAWLRSDLVLPALDTVQEFSCYTSVTCFLDADGTPRVNQPVQLNASAWCWVTVNGYWMELDNDTAHPVTVSTDSTGTITIINKVADLGTVLYWFAGSFLTEQLVVDPSAELRASLTAKLSANPDITTWTYPDGTPLVPAGADPDVVSQAQDSINQLLTSIAPSLPADGSTGASSGGDTTPAAANARLMRTTSFGVVGDLSNMVETAAGDVLQALQAAGNAIYDYVIEPVENAAEKAWQFVVKIGDAVVGFIIRTISEVLQLLSWVFQTLGALIQDLIAFIGFLFSWDDILNTHKVIGNLGEQLLYWGAAMSRGLKGEIDPFFNGLITRVQALCARAADLPDQDLAAVAKSDTKSASPSSKSDMSWLSTSPGGTFSAYQLQHGGVTQGTPPAVADPLEDAFKTVLATVEKVWKDVAGALTGFARGISNLIKTNQFTLKNVALLLTDNVVAAALGAVRDVLDGVCEVASDLLLALVSDVLVQPINIPILTGLYKKISGDDALTLLDAGALLLAIPATMVFKLMAGKAPFPNGTEGWDEKTWEQLFPIPNLSTRTTSFAVRSGAPADSTVTYSRIGGVVAQISTTLYAMLLPLSVYTEKAEMKWLGRLTSMIMAGLYTIGMACTFPYDEDETQWTLDLIEWGFGFIVVLLGGGTALLFGAAALEGPGKAGDEIIKTAEKGLSSATAVTSAIAGAVLGVVAIASYVLELEDPIPPEYHGVFWDTEKLVGNLVTAAATSSEGVAILTEEPEILLGTAVAYGVSIWLTFVRNTDAVFEDHLFQPT